MGLFSKKEVCPVCGRKIKGDLVIKIKDNVPLCRDCSAMVNMDATMIPYQTPEDIRRHIAYREKNLEKYEAFESTLDLKAGSSLLKVDETQKIWYCTRNKKDKNPPVFTYGEIAGYQYLENGEPYAEEEKKGGFGSLFGGKKEPVMIRSMKIHIDLNNPYTPNIDIELMALNDEIKSNSLAYKSNKRAVDRVMDALDGMSGRGSLGEVSRDLQEEFTEETEADIPQEAEADILQEENLSVTQEENEKISPAAVQQDESGM